MKTQTNKNRSSKILLAALASMVLMNVACAKKNSSGGGGTVAAPAPVNPACTTQYCPPGGVVGQVLYGGITTNSNLMQVQFEVSGDPSGNGPGSIVGTVSFNNYICPMGPTGPNGLFPVLTGPYAIQMTQQGLLQAHVFESAVMLVGPQGSFPAQLQVIPVQPGRTHLYPNDDLFSIAVCGSVMDVNF